jgi:hypothetical protein
MKLLEEGRRTGEIEVHACHMVSKEARPKNDKEVCYGHKLYLRETGDGVVVHDGDSRR